MDISVREAATADARHVRDVHVASIEGLAGRAYDAEQVAAWAHDRDPAEYPIESGETYFLVAEQGSRVVGFGWTKVPADDYFETAVEGEVTAIYVHPSVVRQGVGSRIYDELEAQAVMEGVESLGLWASLNAVPFYEAKGFERVTERSLEFRDDVDVPVVEMHKPLGR